MIHVAPATPSSLIVNEIFGPTFQGEGPSLGRLAFFLRLGTCNLHCTWCDTKYTWDWNNYDPKVELKRLTLDDIINELTTKRLPINIERPLLVITGGEPLIQREKLVELVGALTSLGWDIEIETNGTFSPIVFPATTNLWYNVSPKLVHSGNSPQEACNPKVLGHFVHFKNARFKFVVEDVSDLNEVRGIVHAVGIPDSAVWIMPQGQDQQTLDNRAQDIADEVLARGWNMTTRLHIMLWGAKRGR